MLLERELSGVNRLKFRKENPIAGETHQEQAYFLDPCSQEGGTGALWHFYTGSWDCWDFISPASLDFLVEKAREDELPW